MSESETYSARTFDACLLHLVGYLHAESSVELTRELKQEINLDEDLFYFAYKAAQITAGRATTTVRAQ